MAGELSKAGMYTCLKFPGMNWAADYKTLLTGIGLRTAGSNSSGLASLLSFASCPAKAVALFE